MCARGIGISSGNPVRLALITLIILLVFTLTIYPSLSEQTKQPTSLTLFAKSNMVKVGRSIVVLGELKTNIGKPLFNKEVIIEISLDGKNYEPETTVTTDENGSFMTYLSFELATNYFLRAVFLGENDLGSTKSEVVPIIVEREVSKPLNIPIFAHYHVWWSDSLWDNHLGNMTDFPVLGIYHSNDEEIIRAHIDQAVKAGIRGWVISWHFNKLENTGLNLVASYAEEKGFSIFIHHNNLKRTGERRSVESIIFDLNYIVERYSENKAFLLYGKPVVVLAQSYLYSNDEVAQIVNTFKDKLIILGNEREAVDYRDRNGLFSGNYYYWASYNPYTYTSAAKKLVEIGSAVHEVGDALWWAPAAPGYHKFSTGVMVPRNDGLTYIHEFQNSLKSNPDAIVIISWNEWGESTYIEPSEKYGNFYTDLTRDMVSGRFGGPTDESEEGRPTDGSEETMDVSLIITTIPNVSNYTIFINNETYYTNDSGILILSKQNGTIHINVPDIYNIDENERLVFSRWSPIRPQNFTLDLDGGRSYRFYLGLLQQFHMSLTFSNPNSEIIDSSLIDNVTLISNRGDLVQSGFPYEVWLSKNYLISSSQDLRVADLQYDVYHVMVDGVDVSMNKHRQIIPAPGKTFDIQCKLYPLSITVLDIFTGRRLQLNIKLSNINSGTMYRIDPDSDTKDTRLWYEGEEDTVILPNLPAGTYLVSIQDIRGFSFPKTVILNKPSAIIVSVLSYSSLGLLMGISTFFVATVIYIVHYKKGFQNKIVKKRY